MSRGVAQTDLDMTHTYDSEGKMTLATYPAVGGVTGASYSFGYDSMGRPTTMTDQNNPYAPVVTAVNYGPAGELLSIAGQAFSESRSYNSRLQLTSLNNGTSNMTFA